MLHPCLRDILYILHIKTHGCNIRSNCDCLFTPVSLILQWAQKEWGRVILKVKTAKERKLSLAWCGSKVHGSAN